MPKYGNNTLLALVGRHPQIITESLFALKHYHSIEIDRLVIVSTESCARMAKKALLSPQKNSVSRLQACIEEHQLPSLSPQDIEFHVPSNDKGQPIDDVKSPSEMAAMSNSLLKLVKQHTHCNQVQLHASLAGGRKTMTFYLSYAMSVYAREHDTLHHVFVTPQFENSEFYHPLASDSRQQDSVRLADIPFVRLRNNLPTKFFTQTITFSQTELFYKTLNAPLGLSLKPEAKTICCSGVDIPVSAANYAFYSLMLDDLLTSNEGFDCPTPENPDIALAVIYLNKRLEMEGLKHQFTDLPEVADYAQQFSQELKRNEINGLRTGMKKSFIVDRKSQISQALLKELPPVVAEHYDIDSIDSTRRQGANKPVHYFGIQLEACYIN